MDPDFLRIEEVLRIHEDQIERYGGSPGLRDSGLLASAVEMPRATADGEFLHTDLFAMASAYLFHIVQNHPFIDGNKRTGTAAALVFLDFNGVECVIDDSDLVDLVLAIARGETAKDTIAAFLKSRSK